MNSATFDLISDIMRYWFAGLILLIVIRLFFSVSKQTNKESKEKKRTKSNYQMGILEIIDSGDNPKLYGKRFILRRDNVLGRSRKCDIQIAESSVCSIQARIYQRGNQVFLSSMEDKVGIYLNGTRVHRSIPLLNEDEIDISNVVFLLELRGPFAQSQKSYEQREKWEESLNDEDIDDVVYEWEDVDEWADEPDDFEYDDDNYDEWQDETDDESTDSDVYQDEDEEAFDVNNRRRQNRDQTER